MQKIRQNKKPLQKYSKMVLLVIVAFFVAWIATSYTKSEIADRAVVLGLGIDMQDENIVVTAEVISPNEGSDTGSASATSKLLTGVGSTLPLAIQDIFQTSGKNPSLGQTGIILLGESMNKQELKHILSYFILSDAFKDGVTLATCKGSAKQIFESTSPVDSMVSFALQTIIQKSGKKTNSTSNVLQNFVESQTRYSGASFLSQVSFLDDGNQKVNKDKDSNKKTGVYDCSRVSVFKNGFFVDTLDRDETRGFVMLDESKTYDSFVVDDAQSVIGTKDKVSVGIVSKKVEPDVSFDGDKISAQDNLDMKIRRMRTDVTGNVMDLLPKLPALIDDHIKQEVTNQVDTLVQKAFAKSKQTNCDFFGVADAMYKKYGKKWDEYQKQNPDDMDKVEFKIDIQVDD